MAWNSRLQAIFYVKFNCESNDEYLMISSEVLLTIYIFAPHK